MKAKSTRSLLLATAFIAGSAPAQSIPLAATVAVDWLQLLAGGSAAGFALRDDSGTTAATGKVTTSAGILFPGMPEFRGISADFWDSEPPLEDSIFGDASVQGFGVRVAPFPSSAAFEIDLSVPVGRTLYLMVGDIYRDGDSATSGVQIQAYSDLGPGNISLIEITPGHDGIKDYAQALSWDGSFLASTPGSEGESAFAFFEIAPLAGLNGRVVFTIPQAYSLGTGDSLVFALGMQVIPEPSSALLGLLGLGLIARRRR